MLQCLLKQLRALMVWLAEPWLDSSLGMSGGNQVWGC